VFRAAVYSFSPNTAQQLGTDTTLQIITSVCQTQQTVSKMLVNDPHTNTMSCTALQQTQQFHCKINRSWEYAVVEKSQAQTLCTLKTHGSTDHSLCRVGQCSYGNSVATVKTFNTATRAHILPQTSEHV
jgi:hypothetical protein